MDESCHREKGKKEVSGLREIRKGNREWMSHVTGR